MAKAGRADMAIANALGSNVQNVFLALAIPWLMRICTQDYKPYPPSDFEPFSVGPKLGWVRHAS